MKRTGLVGRSRLLVFLTIGLIAGASAVSAQDAKLATVSGPTPKANVNMRLLHAAEAAKTKGTSLGLQLPAETVVMEGDGVLINVTMDSVSPSSAKHFHLPGVSIVHVSTDWNRITLKIEDPEAITKIADISGVRRVFPVAPRKTNVGAAQSEAPRAHGSDRGSVNYGLTGAGQKVGIISDSFAITGGVRAVNTTPARGVAGTLENARNQISGDLPAQVQILKDIPEASFADAIDEGAGMAELVHDIAPGAAIAFHTALSGEADFADGITALRNAGSTVVVDDIIYFAEPMFQDGIIAQSARRCVEAGIPYFSAAGNSANDGFLVEYVDVNTGLDDETFPPTGSDFHRWPNGTAFLPVTILPGNFVLPVVQWNQPFDSVSPGNGSQMDFDVYLVASPTVEAVQAASTADASLTGLSSIDVQGTTGAPAGDAVEIAFGFNGTFFPVTRYLVINHHRGNQDFIPQDHSEPVKLWMVFFGAGYSVEGISNTPQAGGPTIYGHALADGVVSVGAVPWYDTPNFDMTFGHTQQIDPESFTSRGGHLWRYFDDAGNYAPHRRFAPTIAAVDGNNTTFFGSALNLQGYNGEPDQFPNFFGTSASAPNAAAIAALMKEINPGLSPARITEIMQQTAIDVTGRRAAEGFDPETGMDNVTGAGLINGEAAIQFVASEVGRTPAATPTPIPVPIAAQIFNFVGDSEGWTFSSPAFVPAFAFHDPSNALAIGSTANAMTYGIWESPAFTVGAGIFPGDRPLNGSNGPSSLYRATYSVRSNVSDASQVPVFRMRVSTENFEQSSEMVVSSATADNISPTSFASRAYRHYFNLPPQQTRFRTYFEILNFHGVDQANATFFVDQVRVDAMSTGSLFGIQPERTYNFFQTSSTTWTPRDAEPAMVRPTMVKDSGGLRIGPAGGAPGQSNFGYWGSPESDPLAVRMEPMRLYRARFRVSSTATNEQRANIPAFRIRVNHPTLNLCAAVAIESSNEFANVPSGGVAREYMLYLEGRSELQNELGEGQPLLFSFDYILPGDSSNDRNILLRLERVDVESFSRPF